MTLLHAAFLGMYFSCPPFCYLQVTVSKSPNICFFTMFTFQHLNYNMMIHAFTLLFAFRGGSRSRIRNKFWSGLQSFITYACELYEFTKRIKQYSPLN